MLVLTLVLMLLAAAPIQALSTGAPSQACSDLRPGPPHGGVPQTTPSPYELDVDMFQDLSSNDGILVPATYSYTPGRTYDRKWVHPRLLNVASYSQWATCMHNCPTRQNNICFHGYYWCVGDDFLLQLCFK